MTTLWLDLETYCELPITVGTHAYAEKAEVLLAAYAVDDADPVVLDLTNGATLNDIQTLIDNADKVVIHNSAFDRTILKHQNVHLPVQKIHDTMVQALAHSLPGSLGALCQTLGVPVDQSKDVAGKKLIQLFTKPRPKAQKLRRATRETHPDEWRAFSDYAARDILAMRAVSLKLPKWNLAAFERAVWEADQAVNDRGIAVDLDLAHGALRAFRSEAQRLAVQMFDLTGGRVVSATKRDKLLEHLVGAHGLTLESLTKGDVDAILKDAGTGTEVRALLKNRQQASATSPAKYSALIKGTSSDGRLRGTLQYCGAGRTGRWGGRLFQPQNLPRPTLSVTQIENGIRAMKAGCEDLLVANVSQLCSSAVRGALIAAPGRKLVVADLANIEGRMLAWLAGEEWKLQAFRDVDRGVGHDLYVLAYSRSFGVTPEAVLKNKKSGDGRMRQIGKVQELALGYQGGAGAFLSMAGIYGIVLSETEVAEIVKAWRKAHPATTRFWYDVEHAARRAVRGAGDVFSVEAVRFDVRDGWLRIRLPSGRYLCYPEVAAGDDGRLTYMGTNQYTRRWERLETYGGKLVENIVQAASRDVLAHGLLGAEKAGYQVCLHVHDELITETPDKPDYTAEGLEQIMATNPPWSLGLPLAAAGYEAYRYRKD